MSAQAVTWAYKQNISPPTAKFVLVTLADAANGEGYCWPGQQRLMQLTGMSERALRDQIKTLEVLGYIHRERRTRSNGSRTSDGYWLLGFADLPADIAASLPADSAANQPAEFAARTNSQPADSAAPNRQNLPPHTNPKGEPKGLESSSSTQTLAAPAPQRERPRDEIWDAVVAEVGAPATKSEHSDFGKTVSELKSVAATPEQIAAFPRWWSRAHPDAPLTHRCYRHHFGRFRNGSTAGRPPPGLSAEDYAAFADGPIIDGYTRHADTD